MIYLSKRRSGRFLEYQAQTAGMIVGDVRAISNPPTSGSAISGTVAPKRYA